MRLDDDLTCAELVELVSDYLDGALAPLDRERFEEHLVFCAGCETHVEQMRMTLRLVGGLGRDDLGDAAVSELLEAFRGWRRTA